MTTLLIEAALRSLLLAVAVGIALGLLRVRNVLAEKTAWIMVLAAAVVMPLMLVLAMRFPRLPAPRLVLPGMATHAPARTAGMAARKIAPLQPAHASPALSRPAPVRSLGAGSSSELSSGPSAAPIAPLRSGHTSSAGRPFLSKPLDPAGLGLTGAESTGADSGGQIQAKPGTANPALTGAASSRTVSLATFAAMLYLLIAFALSLRLLLGLAVTWRVWRAAHPVPALALEAAEGLRLRASDQISTPVTIGSGVLLPAEYSTWGDEKLRIVLAHERSHVRQGDFYLQLLASLYATLLWLSPLGWWLKRKLSDLGEAIGDRSGLEAASSRTAYARVLLEFAAAPRPTLLGVAMARPSSLSRRMERLLNESAFRQAFSSRGRAFAAALLLPAIFFAAAALVRVEAASDAAGQAATAPEPAQTKAQRQVAHAQLIAAAEAEAAQQWAEAQAQRANAQAAAADEATREAEATQQLAEAQAQAAMQAGGTAPLVSSAPFDAPVIRMQVPDGQPARVPDGVRTVIVMNSPSSDSGSTTGASGSAFAFNQADGLVARLAGVHPLVQAGDAAAEATFDRTLSFSGNLELHAATGCGNIHLTRGAAGQLVVHGDVHSQKAEEADEVRSIAANPPIEQEGNVIRVGLQGEQKQHNHICIDYQIQAPADAALDAASGSGDIVDEGVGQGAKLDTGSGNITATGLTGGFNTETGSGNIAIDEAGEGDAKAETGSGDIDVKGVHGAFKAETGSGDIKVEGTPTSPWKLETGSGSVEFSPGNAPLTLDASTGSGSISTDHPMALQVSSDRHHMRGPLNGGGPDVRIETGSGDITIHD